MKIIGTISYIKIEIDGRTIKIPGEMIVGGFVAHKEGMKKWESPHNNEELSEEMKHEIINKVIEKTKNTHMVISFE
ncbi:hypothetical protein FCL49_11080 [Serratia proteamaculans]|uniref:Imm74 family immunity protein n=1 Tax=Serratia TaxID=613 RepID=UPI001575B1DB|nr:MULTISPECIES: Imm74 family immunity protein [Serratia]NTX79441.1 hypothetical protein [Serratia proteamaculans]NTZ28643.1 hypothetical protein [Serratia proteamaculans]CAI0779902.1 Uncharacterised protein [Serratia quinivorans]